MGDAIRKLVFIALIALLAVSANARSLEQHDIIVFIGPDGIASIQEKYFFSFADANELDAFKQEVKKNGPNFIAWKLFDEKIYPRIAPQGDELSGKSVSFDEASSALELKYALTTNFMRAEEQARTTVFTLIQNRLNSFIHAASFTIPKNTSITVAIPENALMIKALPTPSITGNEIKWQGFLSSNQLDLVYEISKPIAPEVSLSGFVESIFSKDENVFLLAIAAAAIILIYWKKGFISGKIENYVVKHSEIKPEELQEEIRVKA